MVTRPPTFAELVAVSVAMLALTVIMIVMAIALVEVQP